MQALVQSYFQPSPALSATSSASSLDLVSWAENPGEYQKTLSFPAAAYQEPWPGACTAFAPVYSLARCTAKSLTTRHTLRSCVPAAWPGQQVTQQLSSLATCLSPQLHRHLHPSPSAVSSVRTCSCLARSTCISHIRSVLTSCQTVKLLPTCNRPWHHSNDLLACRGPTARTPRHARQPHLHQRGLGGRPQAQNSLSPAPDRPNLLWPPTAPPTSIPAPSRSTLHLPHSHAATQQHKELPAHPKPPEPSP